MNYATIALLVIAGYVAVMSLVRLMIRRRNQLLDRFQAELAAQQELKALAKKKQQEEEERQRIAMARRKRS